MADLRVDREFLERFESEFDVRRPENGAIPARVLAHGKGSAILAIDSPAVAGLVFKRMAVFRSQEEAAHYIATLRRYVRVLRERAGVRVAPTDAALVGSPHHKHWTVYIVQERMAEASLGHNLIGTLSPHEMNHLAVAALAETVKVFDFNHAHQGDLELAIDGRISNWAVIGHDASRAALPDRLRLYYLDIGTPLMRRRGVEQFDPMPLLRTFPAVVVPFVRRALLPDLMTRYYNSRRVSLDLLSSILKEGFGDFLSMLVDSVNWFFLAERQEMHFRPITVQEILAYHRRDAWRWRAYLKMRR